MAHDEDLRGAEREIEQARRSGAEALNLRYMGLIKLPDSLGALTQLQELDASINQLTQLPESLGALTQLQGLYLSRN